LIVSQTQIDTELQRLRKALDSTQTPDPVDVAVVEALASSDVQDLLRPILDDGAILQGVTMEAAGTMTGVAQLTFETTWAPGQSRISPPSRVGALVEVSPPRVLKAVELPGGSTPTASAFVAPSGPVPVGLQHLGIPSASQALGFSAEATRSTADWLRSQGLADRVNAGGGGLTTGTKCTSLLCFERTSDDFD
jgi:hypothetical protein